MSERINGFHLNAVGYQYQVYDKGWCTTVGPFHPNRKTEDLEVRGAVHEDDRPDPVFAYHDLKWAIEWADNLDELMQELKVVKENTQEFDDAEKRDGTKPLTYHEYLKRLRQKTNRGWPVCRWCGRKISFLDSVTMTQFKGSSALAHTSCQDWVRGEQNED